MSVYIEDMPLCGYHNAFAYIVVSHTNGNCNSARVIGLADMTLNCGTQLLATVTLRER